MLVFRRKCYQYVSVAVKSHVCLLKERPDPSSGGTLRWSLSYDDICYCQRVIAPTFISLEKCPKEDDQTCSDILSCNLWFVDDPTLLTHSQNWNIKTLDQLLERTDYCGESNRNKWSFFFFFLYMFIWDNIKVDTNNKYDNNVNSCFLLPYSFDLLIRSKVNSNALYQMV